MNPNQFATAAEAASIAALLGGMGGGVASTYIPEYDGPYSVPSLGEAKFYHFRFANGADGFNVGLIRTLMKQCPLTWPLMVATEIHYQVPLAQVPIQDNPDAAVPVPSPIPPIGNPGVMPPLKPGQIMTPFGPAAPIKAAA